MAFQFIKFRSIFRYRKVLVFIWSLQKPEICVDQLKLRDLKYLDTSLGLVLKEQYPVTAHAPNFEFWTGCREIKRCEESKRILKNPFASRLAGFNTTLKLLRITDQ